MNLALRKIIYDPISYIHPQRVSLNNTPINNPVLRSITNEMIVLQYHEGGVNPAKLLNQFVDSEEQKEVAGLFNARIPLETDEERRRALHDVICNMKENSIAHQSAHMNVTDMTALQKLMADKKSLERWKAGELPDFMFE